MNMPKASYKEITKVVRTVAPKKMNTLVLGPPGSAKSAVGIEIGESLAARVVVFNPCVDEEIDYKGFPTTVNGHAEFMPYGNFRLLIEAEEPTFVILDDLPHAPRGVQAALMHLIHGRSVNGMPISDNVLGFFATGNRVADIGSGANKIITPLLDRFHLVYNTEPDVSSWLDWATRNYLDPTLVTFIRQYHSDITREDCAFNLEPELSGHKVPTFRSLHALSDIIKADCYSLATATASVGENFATRFDSHRKIAEKIPALSVFWDTPEAAPIPIDAPDLMYNIVQMLPQHVDENNLESFLVYMRRIPPEFAIIGFAGAVNIPDIAYHKDFVAWCEENSYLFEA